jgi:hypothetical protein
MISALWGNSSDRNTCRQWSFAISIRTSMPIRIPIGAATITMFAYG